MVTDYFFVYSYFFQFWTMKFQIIKNFWDMEIIGNRRKMSIFKFDDKTIFTEYVHEYWQGLRYVRGHEYKSSPS
jgi:hypothetical protein